MVSPHYPSSPSHSITSSSSFVMFSNHQPDSTTTDSQGDDSGDEILYSISTSSDNFAVRSLSSNENESDVASDIDYGFVILSRPRSQAGLSTPTSISSEYHANTPDRVAELADHLASFNLGDANTPVGHGSRSRKKSKKVLKPQPSLPVVATTTTVACTKKRPKNTKSISRGAPVSPSAPCFPSKSLTHSRSKRTKSLSSVAPKSERRDPEQDRSKKAPAHSPGLGARSVVDDSSERFSEYGGSDVDSFMYDEAVKYISSFLSNPAARKDSACRLTLLQALIIELGLASSSLPASLNSAKAFLKSRAFLNVREYLAVRHQGPAAVQNIMHPSRMSLIKDIRKSKNNRAPRGWVKDSGLQVLLVQCYR